MFIALANPANVLALVEALEKAQAENEYIRKRYQQLDLLIGKISWLCRLQSSNGRPLAMLKRAGVDL